MCENELDECGSKLLTIAIAVVVVAWVTVDSGSVTHFDADIICKISINGFKMELSMLVNLCGKSNLSIIIFPW